MYTLVPGYLRRKQWEARLQAKEIAIAMSELFGGKVAPAQGSDTRAADGREMRALSIEEMRASMAARRVDV